MEKKGDRLESEISCHDDIKHKNALNEENAFDSRSEMVQSIVPSNKESKEPVDAVETGVNNVSNNNTTTDTSSTASNTKEIVNKATPITKQPYHSHNTVTKERSEQVRPQSAEPYFPSRDNTLTSSHVTNRNLEDNKTICTNKTCRDVTNATTLASASAAVSKYNMSLNDNQVCNDPHHSSHQPVEPTGPSFPELLSFTSTSTSTSMIVHASSSPNTHVHHTMPQWHSSHTDHRPISAELTSSPSSSTSSLDRQRSASMKWPHIRRSASSPHHLRAIASQPVMTPSAIHPQSLTHSQNMNEGLVQDNNNNNIHEIDNNDAHMNCKDNNTNKSNAQRNDHEVASGININVFKPSSIKYNINNNNINNNSTISNELIHSSSQPQTPSESAQMRHMHFSQLQRTAPSVLRSTHAASSPQLLSNTPHMNMNNRINNNNNNNNNNDTSVVESYSDDARHTPRAQVAPPLSFESLHRNFATQDTSTNMSICTGRSTSSRWSTSLNTPREEPSYPNTQFIHANVQNNATNTTITYNTSTQPSRQSVSPNVLLTPMALPTQQQQQHSISTPNAVNNTIEPTPHEENDLLLQISVVDLEKQYTEEAANLSRDALERSVCELRRAHRVQMNRLDNLEKKYAELERGLNAHFAVAEMPQEAISNHFLRKRDKLEKRKYELMTRYEQIEKEVESKQTELQQVNSTIDKIERLINRDVNQNSMWEETTLLQAQAANTKVERMLKDEKCTLQELEMLINSEQSEEPQKNEEERESLTNATSASREQEEEQVHSSSELLSTELSTHSKNKQDKTGIEERNDAIQNRQGDDREITHILRDEIAELMKNKTEQEKRIKSLKKSKQEISRRLRKVQEDKKREGDKVLKIEREYKDVKNTVKERSTKLHFAQEIESERLLNTRSITSFSNLEMPYGGTPHHSQSRTPHRNWSVTRSNSSYGRSDPRATSSIQQQHKQAQVAHTNTKDVATDNNNRNEYDDRTCTEDYADDENDESDEEEWEAVNNNHTENNEEDNNNNNVTDVKQSELENANENKNNTHSDRDIHSSLFTGETHHECKSNAWPLSFSSLLNASSSSSQIHSHGHVPEQLPETITTSSSSSELTQPHHHLHQQQQKEKERPYLSSTNPTTITHTQTHLSNAQDRIETYTSPADWLRQGAIHQENTDPNWHESFAPPLSLTSRHATQRTTKTNTNTNGSNSKSAANTPSKDRTRYSPTSTLLENNPHVTLTSAYTTSSSTSCSFVQHATQEHSKSVNPSRHHAHSSSWTLPSQSHPITPHHNVISVQETARMSAPHLLNSSESTPQRVFCQDALDSITHLDLNEDYDTNVTENYDHHNNNTKCDEHSDKS